MSYDSSLLAHAPHVTKAEHQEGYNVDILNHANEHGEAASTPSRTPQPVRRAPSPETTGTPTDEKPRQQRSRSNSKFWLLHTPAGRIALAILAFLVVGAIVGGAVGGTVGRHKSKSTSSSSNGNGESQGSSSSGDDGQAGSSIASIGLQPTQGAATALPGGSVQPQPTSGQGMGQGSGGGELGGRIGGSR